MPFIDTVPIGIGATRAVSRRSPGHGRPRRPCHRGVPPTGPTWYAQSVDSNYLHRQAVFIFGDATHAIAARGSPRRSWVFALCGLGTYMLRTCPRRSGGCRHLRHRGTDQRRPLEVEDASWLPGPNWCSARKWTPHCQAVEGSLRRHLGTGPCAGFPRPLFAADGFEGANVIFDSWVHPLMMGLEEHLLQMFRSDFEFNDGAVASHLHAHSPLPRPARFLNRPMTGAGGESPDEAQSPEPVSRPVPLDHRCRKGAEKRSPSSCAARPPQHRDFAAGKRHPTHHRGDAL